MCAHVRAFAFACVHAHARGTRTNVHAHLLLLFIGSREAPGYIAQWLERLTADQQVPGSNPGVPFDGSPSRFQQRAWP